MYNGDRLVEHHALWFFPTSQERYLVSSHQGVDEYYVLVRLEGKACLDKLSLGVCKNADGDYGPSSLTAGAPSDIDPTDGYVVRIVSVERDGEPLQDPEDASPYLHQARHVREVIRRQAAKCNDGPTTTSSGKFGVLRTSEYIEAKELLEADDCDPDDWERCLATLENPSSFPWKLAHRVAELGYQDTLNEAGSRLRLSKGKVHIVDDIWLVDEGLPSASNEFAVAARWAVQKSIHGAGSIPRMQMWEPVVVLGCDDETLVFQLMRTA